MRAAPRLPSAGRQTVELVRAGWDDDATNDKHITLYEPRAEGFDPAKGSLPTGVIDGFVSARERKTMTPHPELSTLAPNALENDARRRTALSETLGLSAGEVDSLAQSAQRKAHLQVRMSPDALTSFLSEGRFRTAYEVAVHHDQEPVTDEYVTLRAKKEATTGLGRVVYASVGWDAVSRESTAPYGGAVVILRSDRVANRVTITERETFAYTDDRAGFENDVVTWNQLGSLVTHFIGVNKEPAGNFERTGSAPHIEAQIRPHANAPDAPIVGLDDLDAILLPDGAQWDAIADQTKSLLAEKGVRSDLVEVVRYTPAVPEAFDTAGWLPQQ